MRRKANPSWSISRIAGTSESGAARTPAWRPAGAGWYNAVFMSRYEPPRAKQSGYITPEGARKMREELEQLWLVERPKVTQEVSDAAAQGDRSENAEYIYGKRRLREIDRRVRFLNKRLEELKIVDEPPSNPRRVFFGAWVTLEDEDGNALEYRIVGPDEFDVSAGKISMDSPVGRALMGKHLDAEVTVRRPKGDIVYTITDIRYER